MMRFQGILRVLWFRSGACTPHAHDVVGFFLPVASRDGSLKARRCKSAEAAARRQTESANLFAPSEGAELPSGVYPKVARIGLGSRVPTGAVVLSRLASDWIGDPWVVILVPSFPSLSSPPRFLPFRI